MFSSNSAIENGCFSKQAELRVPYVSCSALPGSFRMVVCFVLFCFAILGAKSKAFVYAGQSLYTELLTTLCASYVRVCNMCPQLILETLRRAT